MVDVCVCPSRNNLLWHFSNQGSEINVEGTTIVSWSINYKTQSIIRERPKVSWNLIEEVGWSREEDKVSEIDVCLVLVLRLPKLTGETGTTTETMMRNFELLLYRFYYLSVMVVSPLSLPSISPLSCNIKWPVIFLPYNFLLQTMNSLTVYKLFYYR